MKCAARGQPFVAVGTPAPPFPRSVAWRMLRKLQKWEVSRTDLRSLEQQATEMGADPTPLPTSAPLLYASGAESEGDD